MGDLTEHFSRREFACRCGCGLNLMDRGLVDRLEAVRRLFGRAIVLTSGTRCPRWNADWKGEADSAHLDGKAVDILCRTSVNRYDLLMALLTHGITRLGIYESWIHADVDYTKPQEVCWVPKAHA